MPLDTLRERVDARLTALTTERTPWVDTWRSIRDLLLPYRGRFLAGAEADRYRNARQQDGRRINNSATQDLNVLASGLASGLTNPASDWFRLRTQDPGLMSSTAVRLWLEAAEQGVYRVFGKSNFYQQLDVLYSQLGAYGTAVIFHDEDPEDVARFRTFSIGEYYLANDSRGLATTCYRRFVMTVDQVVQTFVAGPNRTMNWAAVSDFVKRMWDDGATEQPIVICHSIEPSSPRLTEAKAQDGGGATPGLKRWPYVSVYWEQASDDRKRVLRVGGYQECPAHSPRWDVELPDAYGIGPGANALGDMRQLQIGERRLAQQIDRGSGFGPLTGPPGVTLADLGGDPYIPNTGAGGAGSQVRPLYDIPPAMLQMTGEQLARLEQRIGRTFFKDLFLLVAEIERSGVTATEIDQKTEEKLVVLGPVVNRSTEELTSPAVDRAFAQLLRFSQPRWKMNQPAPLPPPPQELSGQELKVEYVGLLARAQRARKADGLGRLVQTSVVLRQVQQDIGDKINGDELLDELAEDWGVSPRVLHGADEVAQVRQSRAQAAAQQQTMAQTASTVDAASKLGRANMQGTALGALLGQSEQGKAGPQGVAAGQPQGAPAPANAA